MSISQKQIVRKPLLKTYFLLIRSQLICLTFFRQFWSWTPLTKPISTEWRYLRLLVSHQPKRHILLVLHFFPLNKRINLLEHWRLTRRNCTAMSAQLCQFQYKKVLYPHRPINKYRFLLFLHLSKAITKIFCFAHKNKIMNLI